MKMNSDLLHYQLANIVDVERVYGTEKNVFVKRPIFFERSKFISEHLVIIKPEMIGLIPESVHNIILICIGIPENINDDFRHDLFIIKKSVHSEQIFNILQSIFDIFDEWDDRLKEIYNEDMGFSEVIESCKIVTHSPISIIDTDFSYVAYSKDSSKKYGLVDEFVDDYNYLPLNKVNEIISQPGYYDDMKIKESFLISRDQYIVAKNVFYNELYVGRISTMQEKNPLMNTYNAEIFQHMNAYVEKMYQKYKGFHYKNPKMDKLHQMLSESLKGIKFSNDAWENTLDKLKWSRDDEFTMVQLSPGHAYSKELYVRYLCPQIEKLWKGSCAFSLENRIVLLINKKVFAANNGESFNQALAYFLRESLTIAGVSRDFKYIANNETAYEQTEIALKYGKEKDPMLWAFHFDNYALDYLIENGTNNHKAEHICHKSLLILKDHDAHSGSELHKTLFTFFKTNFNASSAAEELSIHRSTFINRMERIESLTHINLDDWNTKLYIMISFQMTFQ